MSDLIDRYVWAVARELPSSLREDVARELRATIADMVEARGADDEQASRDVLMELGDPVELAAQYTTRPRYLIGPGLYVPYIRLLKTLLPIVIAVVLAVTLATELWATEEEVALGVFRAIEAALQTGMVAAFVVTLVFAILQRAGVDTAGPGGRGGREWVPESLPKVAEKRQITLGEFIAAMVFLSLPAIWVAWQQSHSPFSADGRPVPFLDQGLWQGWIPAFILLITVSMSIEVWKYISGRWTLPMVVANVAMNVVFVGFVVALLRTQQVVNPAFVAALEEKVGESLPGVAAGFALVLVVVGIAVWDTVDCVLKYLRGRRTERPGILSRL
jgi:hypothetical protein